MRTAKLAAGLRSPGALARTWGIGAPGGLLMAGARSTLILAAGMIFRRSATGVSAVRPAGILCSGIAVVSAAGILPAGHWPAGILPRILAAHMTAAGVLPTRIWSAGILPARAGNSGYGAAGVNAALTAATVVAIG